MTRITDLPDDDGYAEAHGHRFPRKIAYLIRNQALEEAAKLVDDMSGSFDEFSPRSYAAAIRALKEEGK